MYLSKNKCLIIILLLLIIGLTGCTKVIKNNIEAEDIYNQEEEEYLIYFYKNKCPYCKECKDTINDYIESDNQTIKLYTCNLTKEKIKRYYEEETGQGSKGQYLVDGISDYNELYIAGVPTIIKVKIENNKKISEYIVSGKSKVIDYINDLYKEE